MKLTLILGTGVATVVGVVLGLTFTPLTAVLLGGVCGGGVGYAIDQILEG